LEIEHELVVQVVADAPDTQPKTQAAVAREKAMFLAMLAPNNAEEQKHNPCHTAKPLKNNEDFLLGHLSVRFFYTLPADFASPIGR
jgi:hypothetical protein